MSSITSSGTSSIPSATSTGGVLSDLITMQQNRGNTDQHRTVCAAPKPAESSSQTPSTVTTSPTVAHQGDLEPRRNTYYKTVDCSGASATDVSDQAWKAAAAAAFVGLGGYMGGN